MTDTQTQKNTAVATSPTQAVAPNLFTFTGRRDDIQIVFSETSFTGQPQFTYHDDTRDVTANGSEITVERGVLGRLVTITVESVPDLHVITATLVLPDFGGLSGPVTSFRTFVVLTTNRTSIGGPNLVTGAIQRYSVVRGDATAQQVQF
jgi:hypothetical protein